MKSFVKILCVSGIAILTACQNNNKTASTASDTTKTATSPGKTSTPAGGGTASAYNYSIQIPVGWHQETKQMNGRTLFFLIGPKEMDYTTNMNIIKDSMKGETLDDYIKISLAKMQSMNVTVGNSNDIKVDGMNGKSLKYIYNAQQRTIAVKSYIFPKNDTAYIVTATTIPELGKKYEPVFDNAVNTLKVK